MSEANGADCEILFSCLSAEVKILLSFSFFLLFFVIVYIYRLWLSDSLYLTETYRSNDRYRYMWCVQVLRSPKEAFAAAMQSWRERCEKCVCLQGDYVEK